MIKFKVLANVNPLKKNELMVVFDSDQIMSSDNDECLRKVCSLANDLALQGFNVRVYRYEKSVIDYTKFFDYEKD